MTTFFFEVSISENNLQPSIKKLLTERKITTNKHQHCGTISLFSCFVVFSYYLSLDEFFMTILVIQVWIIRSSYISIYFGIYSRGIVVC